MVEQRGPIADVRPAVHGGLRRREIEAAGLDPSQVMDFSASLNPYGPPSGIAKALRQAIRDISTYPEPGAEDLEEAIAEKVGCSPEEVLAGAGSTQLIHLTARVFAGEVQRVLIPAHTYGEYEVAARAAGARMETVPMPDLRLEAETLTRALRKRAVLYLCNPNNPTGQYFRKQDLYRILEASEDSGSLVVVDEAFRDFVPDAFDSVPLALDSEHAILLRSFTKVFNIPGVRIGYAIGASHLLEPLRGLRPPWSVDAFGQAAGLAALEEDQFVVSSRERLWRNRRAFEASLRVLPSMTNFFLLPVEDARRVRSSLLRRGYLVRDCTSFGLPGHIRFAVRRPRENAGLIRAIMRVVPSAAKGA